MRTQGNSVDTLRVKLQVWNRRARNWRTVWVKPELLQQNIDLLAAYGVTTRVPQ